MKTKTKRTPRKISPYCAGNTYIVTVTGNDVFRATIKVTAWNGTEANEKAAAWMAGRTIERLSFTSVDERYA